MEQAEVIIRGIQNGLLQWYDFHSDSTVLYMGKAEDPLAEMLADRAARLVCAVCGQIYDETWRHNYKKQFDYIILIESLEREKNPIEVLRNLKEVLQPDGRMLLGVNNRFGIRYFCGDRDPYTGRSFDGIENYRRAYFRKEDIFYGRMYSQAEWKEMLRNTGWDSHRFYSVLSDLHNPALLYAENFLPNEDLAGRVFPTYNYPESVFLEEEGIYADLAANGMFHQMANAYLIECAPDGVFSDVNHVTSSMERGRECALFTIIHASGTVEKRAAYPESDAGARLRRMVEFGQDLAAHGIRVVEAKIEGDSYIMPYVQAEVGHAYLKRLALEDTEKFLEKLDHFRDLILRSSEIIKPDAGDGNGAVLRRGYLDMVPLNSFYLDDTFVFYDQEFCEENYPANAILVRMIATLYAGSPELQKTLPAEELFRRYGLWKKLDHFRKMEWKFLEKLRKERELRSYHEDCRRNDETLHLNRQRMNYSAETYERLFVDIFRNADTRKLILFGSGNFTQKFLALYQKDYPVYAIIDNNQSKWGTKIEGIEIHSPRMLEQLQAGEYKVLICIKNYLSVMKQLDEMGVAEYSIFDFYADYPRKPKNVTLPENFVQAKEELSGQSAIGNAGTGTSCTVKKKYHVGYIAGVFDLFHVGHLNMFKRAKEQCDYLIVGVVTDEGVRKHKEVETFVPYEERAEMVRSCRYVDEVVEIPLNYGGTRDAWRLYHFDCQFSGSDYVDNPDWLAEKKFLEKHGAEMQFFPYTQSTSSTKIKALIEKKLM